jgi:hypothetical protein
VDLQQQNLMGIMQTSKDQWNAGQLAVKNRQDDQHATSLKVLEDQKVTRLRQYLTTFKRQAVAEAQAKASRIAQLQRLAAYYSIIELQDQQAHKQMHVFVRTARILW